MATKRVGEELVRRGVLILEPDVRDAEVRLEGVDFRYTVTFWERLGAIIPRPDGKGWTDGAHTPEEDACLRVQVAAEWEAAGAPRAWAQKEAAEAVQYLFFRAQDTTWGSA